MTNKNVKLTWGQFRDLFMAYNDIRTDTNNAPGTKPALYGVVVFKSSNWPDKNYALDSRSYLVDSKQNAFDKNMFSNSCFAKSLDGSDPYVNLAWYDWEVDYCYLP